MALRYQEWKDGKASENVSVQFYGPAWSQFSSVYAPKFQYSTAGRHGGTATMTAHRTRQLSLDEIAIATA